MRIAFIADVHLGNHARHGGPVVGGLNLRCRQTLDVLRVACSAECDELVVLGDLFDTTCPAPQIIHAAGRALYSKVPIVMLGNHEYVSAAAGDNAVEVLRLAEIEVYAAEPHISPLQDAVDLLVIPWNCEPAPKVIRAALVAASWRAGVERILALHCGIADGDTPGYLRNGHDWISASELASLCAEHGVGAVFAGHWHAHKRWAIESAGKLVKIMQVGALVPTGWDNPGADGYGTVAIWEDGKVEVTFLDGPRFYPRGAAAGDALVYVDDAPPMNVAAEAARGAVNAVRGDATVDEAIAQTVAAMALPDGVSAAEVIAAAKGYMT